MSRRLITATALLSAPLLLGLLVLVTDDSPDTLCTAGAAASRLDTEQATNAATIIAVGRALHIPPRGWVIAIATARRESNLHNLAYGDRDSLGLFQQRPSQNWGTRAQLLDPRHAAAAFYRHLGTIAGWPSLPLTVAAQAVQRSAYPDAYAAHEAAAAGIVTAVTGTDPASLCVPVDLVVPGHGAVSLFTGLPRIPAGYRLPTQANPAAAAALRFALAQVGKPYLYGATGPSAWDCSSLMQAAWRQAGVSLARTTYTQVRQGSPVPLMGLAPGDLVFTPGVDGSAANPGHVGMYAGAGYVIQATHTGDYVRVTPLATWLGKNEIVAIRHIAGPSKSTARGCCTSP